MSRPQPQRPSVQRKTEAVGNSVPSQRKVLTQEELNAVRALPTSEDTGTSADLDPENAAAGKIVNETVVVHSAKFVIQDWKRKDGTYPETAVPEVQLQVFFYRDGDDEGDKPYRQEYKYGSASVFVPSVDGRFVNVRKSVIKPGVPVPRPNKKMAGVRFLQSIKNARGENIIERMKTEGTDALKGLKIAVRLQKTSDMSEKSYPVLLVDYIDGIADVTQNTTAGTANTSPANTVTSAVTVSVPAQTVNSTDNNEVESLAEEALLDILSGAPNNSLSRAQIPSTIIQNEKWKAHKQRGVILKTLRDDAFVNKANALWKVSGNTISL